MKVETNIREVPLQEVGTAAQLVEELGYDSLAQSEIRRDPFIALTLAASATKRVRLAPAVAIVFPRSPMIVAYMSHNLQELSGGRFALGMGTQVKGHITRRFSTEWGQPGPRLREYVLALRAIWDTFQTGAKLSFEGDFYSFNLMTPEFNLGPSPYFPIPIQLAAVNTYLARTAGELCDGLRVHGFSTPEYIRDVLWPAVIKGAQRSGRSLDTFEMIGGGFTATGPDEEAVAAAREGIRYRVAWYASTRTYLPVLEHHGWEGINPELRKLIAEERWDELSSLVTDEMLDVFCVTATYENLPAAIERRMGGLTDTLSFPLPADAIGRREQLADTITRLRSVRSATDERRAQAGLAAAD